MQDVNGEDDEDEVVITFYPQPTIGTPVSTTFEQCDTDTNQDGFFTFDLAALFGNDLLNGQDPTVFEVALLQFPKRCRCQCKLSRVQQLH